MWKSAEETGDARARKKITNGNTKACFDEALIANEMWPERGRDRYKS